MTPALPAELAPCRLLFTGEPAAVVAPGAPALQLALDPLAGAGDDTLFNGLPEERAGLPVFVADGCIAGYAVADPAKGLEEGTTELYERLFEATSGLSFYRIWNYVPSINRIDDGLEVYRRFSRARSVAFERRFGAGFASLLPAASAVGSSGGPLAVAFLAGAQAPKRFENPRQVPAYAYPAEHGPRSPSFCRALRVQVGRTDTLFISGTASIRGHESLGTGDIAAQLKITLENLHAVGQTAGLADGLGRKAGWHRHVTVYVKRPQDLERVKAALAAQLSPTDHVAYVRADICRSELWVEIEVTLRRAL